MIISRKYPTKNDRKCKQETKRKTIFAIRRASILCLFEETFISGVEMMKNAFKMVVVVAFVQSSRNKTGLREGERDREKKREGENADETED